MSMPEEVGMFLFSTTGFATFMWYRAVQARKQIENRLWGMAAAQGLPVAALGTEMPLQMMARASQGAPPSRVDQLEQQIDQMAQQIDRLAESQEFLSRVLTERIEQLPDPRMRTPHRTGGGDG